MRILIDIEGDEVRVHRIDGGELPPADILRKAAAINAQSAGVANFRRPDLGEMPAVISAEDLRIGATDAGRGPSGRRRDRQTKRTASRPRPGAKRGRRTRSTRP